MGESVVFFGTGPVAAASLRLLIKHTPVEAVITKPRPAHHKGEVPVLSAAQELGLRVIEVANKQDVTLLTQTTHFSSRLGVLIDFGIIVEQKVIDAFPLGIVNSHFSLLPQWRGADPITFSILSGQQKTGVSLMLLVPAMDEGPLLAVAEYEIPPETTTPQLTEALIQLSDGLLLETLPKYSAGNIKSAPQEKVASIVGYEATPTYSRKLSKEDGILDWTKPAEQLEREIRAYTEWPKSRCMLGGHAVIVTKAHATPTNRGGRSGHIEVIKESGALTVECVTGMLYIDSLKPAGKREMTTREFINGYGKDL